MELFSQIIGQLNTLLSPVLVVGLLGTGIFLTIRLGFVQFRRLGHGFAVTSGRYDDPDEPGDVSHFQALTTALSATVGIGNIAGVAIAIHWGGPGALFWMWMTALLGMATKYSEVTLAQHFRETTPGDGSRPWEGTVSGGPMYYIEKGLGKRWKPVAVFFAFMLMITSFFTGNAIQANTIATQVQASFGIDLWITGLVTASIVGLVIIGGIRRIGAVTSVLAPVMAAIYVSGALVILILNADAILPTFGLIFSEAFNPTAGVAGTGVGVFIYTMRFGVQRGLFSNEAGQGSAPIAHSAAKTDEPVSEGVVALLEPFIDTIIICTMTALVILTTGSWEARIPTQLQLGDPNVTFVEIGENDGMVPTAVPEAIIVDEGFVAAHANAPNLAYYDVAVEQLFLDPEFESPFTGTIYARAGRFETAGGERVTMLYGQAVRNSSPLTTLGFERGLEPLGLGALGRFIVLISVFLFALSTSISWSYYGDRCANYLFGPKGILPFKVVFVVMHFIGATLAITTIWDLGDTALSLVTLPNVLSLIVLSGVVKKLTDSYFERKPWIENEEAHRRAIEKRRQRPPSR